LFDITNCKLCPRKCGIDRTKNIGFCGGGANIKAARAELHYWEEPCISGSGGSGAVFFSGCSLKCCFCQNYSISAENFGKEISIERLADIFLELQEKGAHNINLVNPTHYVPWIIKALNEVKLKLYIPVLYNSGGYESTETLKTLDGYIDIYLPDIKYQDSERAKKYSCASDYFDAAAKAVIEMYRQVGKIEYSGETLKKGLLIRHMVMPGGSYDSIGILEWIAENLPKDEILVSIMSQYTPSYRSRDFAEINRQITKREYNSVIDRVCELGLNGFMQEKSSADEEYTPKFDLTGI
jgi:putative pyruvate formate lyase activating enzyme